MATPNAQVENQHSNQGRPWRLREHRAEIYRLRMEEGWTFEKIAAHFGCKKQAIAGAISSYLSELAKQNSPALDSAGSSTTTEGNRGTLAPDGANSTPASGTGPQPISQEETDGS